MTDGTQIGIPQDGVEHVVENVVEKLTERQKDILRLITQNAHITAKEIGTAIGVSDSTINRETDWMQEKGILSRTTKNRYGKWVILLPTQDE